MTGDDNQIDRKRILREMDTADKDKAVILVATQVVEAGIDIDMDIGYKDISKLESSSSGELTGILKEKVLSIFSIWIMKVVFIRRIIVLIQRIH